MLTPKWRALSLLMVAQILALSLWFSATAIVPALRRELMLSDAIAALFTSAVQAGFVCGTLASALFGLADRLDPRRFFAAASVVAALANALIPMLPTDLLAGPVAVPLLRFITGMAMAGIYPIGMKLAASWVAKDKGRSDLGLLVGLLVGALTLGSALPHLFNALGGFESGSLDWRAAIAATSLAAFLAAGLILCMEIGPARAAPRIFKAHYVLMAWQQPALRCANLGYLGHMWELYAMWAWIAVFLAASIRVNAGGLPADWVAAAPLFGAFATIAAGAIGSLAGGWAADRWGRTTLTIAALAVSGTCSVVIGFLFGASPFLLLPVCLIWGISIVADSAQFSASISELSEPELIGTMLTVQTCAGFLLTLFTIHLIPIVVDWVGWSHAFSILALGPIIGIMAMRHLRRLPDSKALAGGKR